MGDIATVLTKDIYQKNPLLQARKGYKVLELRIFELGIMDVNPHLKGSKFYDRKFRTYHLDTQDLYKILSGEGVDRKDLHKLIKESCERMAKSAVLIGTIDKFDAIPVFQRIRFDAKKGLDLCFNMDMAPYLIDLQDGDYTRLKIENALQLDSTYAINLLNLLLKDAYTGKKIGVFETDIDIETLRFVLDVPQDAYKGRINNFRSRVLDVPIREIEEKRGYHIQYKTIKKGRKVTGFSFLVSVPEEFLEEKPSRLSPQPEDITEAAKDAQEAERDAELIAAWEAEQERDDIPEPPLKELEEDDATSTLSVTDELIEAVHHVFSSASAEDVQQILQVIVDFFQDSPGEGTKENLLDALHRAEMNLRYNKPHNKPYVIMSPSRWIIKAMCNRDWARISPPQIGWHAPTEQKREQVAPVANDAW